MNPLESFKEKLKIKPTVEEREKIAVIIKGIKSLEKTKPVKKLEKSEVEDEIKNAQKEDEDIIEEIEKEEIKKRPLIVDETKKGYDRQSLFKKMTESKMSKVTIKPALKASIPEILIETIEPKKVKKAKKFELKRPLVIEEEELEEEKELGEKELGEEEIEEAIVIKEPKKRGRITKKVEKGIAVLGPETVIDFGDTTLDKRLPKKSQPINIKVSSYIMNNREKFVNFINSLFEPYRQELQENKENISCDTIGNTGSNFSLLTHQKIVRDYMNLYTPYRGLLLYHGLGSGKCHKINTPIIMSDGSIKLVQDIKVGDFLMGDDSKPREIYSLARGKDKMYDVISIKGNKYTVNQEHILCLKAFGFPKINLQNQKENQNQKSKYNIQWIENNKFQSKTFTFNSLIEDDKNRSKTDAYLFFDEIKNNIKTSENIIEISVKDYLQLSKKKKGILKGYSVPIEFPEKTLPIAPYVMGCSLGDDETVNCIPMIYKCNSRENRLNLLAGLLDSYGNLSKKNNSFEFAHKNELLIDDVIYVARSLGFSCDKSVKNDTIFRTCIHTEALPTLHTKNSKKQIENNLLTSIKVEYVNEDDYYGFTIDGNCRYLMGDFTVTHNTATSIAIAEGMKDSKKIIIMTPASLRTNYMEELKKAGDLLYKKNQYWEWISIETNPESAQPISAILNLPLEYIRRQHGAWFINIKKQSNYEDLSSVDKKSLDDQLNEMIRNKYTFINYNGLRTKRLEELTSGFTRNLFDNAVIIIDEAHNLISRIVNKIKKEKTIEENDKGEKEHAPRFLSTKLYEYLLSARNARVVLLTGTPVINYPNEFAILFNILRGYIKTWNIPLTINTNKKIDKNSLSEMLLGEKSLDYLDYSPSSKVLTITRNPFGFKNKIKKDAGYQGVTNVKKDEKGDSVIIDSESEYTSDEDFQKKIINILKRNDIDVIVQGIKIKNKKALPDDLDQFILRYIDVNGKIKNIDALKRRILGLSSYFKSAQESLLPKFNKTIGVDYHVVRIPMSDVQFKIYEMARKEERKTEKPRKTAGPVNELFSDEKPSTYRIFSRLFCNFVMPNRPIPDKKSFKDDADKSKKTKEKEKEEEKEREENGDQGISDITEILKVSKKAEGNQDINDDNEGEIEGDEILDKIGGITYKERINEALHYIKEHSNDFLTPEALETYSPKFLNILENIKDPDYAGLHLLYSQFRTLEGIGVFSLVLEKNGFARFKIKKNSSDVWEMDMNEVDYGKPTFALYTGTETAEEKEIIRNIYNGDWEYVPSNIANELKKISNNNNMGEIIKVLMITSSGSEGINLRNTRYVHIMEPYWHPVRLEQVIGRARRICSHKSLPIALQTVEVFVYLMIFSAQQISVDNEEAKELKRKDLSKSTPSVPITSDQYLYEISEIKANLTSQLTDAIKESSFDCYIYGNGKCVNFGNPTNDKFSYVPDYAEQQNDITTKINQKEIEWVGKPVTLNGVKYIYRRMNKKLLNIYSYESYQEALKTPGVYPVQIGTLEVNDKGEQVFKELVL